VIVRLTSVAPGDLIRYQRVDLPICGVEQRRRNAGDGKAEYNIDSAVCARAAGGQSGSSDRPSSKVEAARSTPYGFHSPNRYRTSTSCPRW
jgi:hypothetical protein